MMNCPAESELAVQIQLSPPPRHVTRYLLYSSLALNLVASTAVLLLRLRSNLQAGALFSTNGAESLMAYSIWKLQNSYPLYEMPWRSPYSLTLYNYLFYESYARILQALGFVGSSLMVYGRVVTLVLTSIGIVATTYIMRDGNPGKSRKQSIVLFITVSVLVWLSSSFLGWYVLTLRPDVAAVGIACVGLLVAARAIAKNSSGYALMCSALFYCSWAFKQSSVSLFLGTCIYFTLTRRWRLLGVLAATFAGAVMITLLVGGPDYRYSILVAPRVVDSYSMRFAVSEWIKASFLNLYIWAGALFGLGCILRRDLAHLSSPPNGQAVIIRRLVGCCFIVAVPVGSVLLSKTGAAKNHLLEAFVMAAILTGWQTIQVIESEGKKSLRFTFVLLCLAWGGYPLTQLAFANMGAREQGVGVATGVVGLTSILQLKEGKTPWHVQLAYQGEMVRRSQIAAELGNLPKPLYIRDEMFLLPWYSTDSQYPAYNPDLIYETAAVSKGIMEPSVDQLIRIHHFATLLLRPQDELFQVAKKCGYVSTSNFGAGGDTLVILTHRPPKLSE